MTSTAKRIKRRKSKKRLKKPKPNWSDLPRDIVRCIIEHMYWADRIRIRAVCKAWSFPNRHIPAIDKVPWAMVFSWKPIDDDQISGQCRLLDPLSREYVAEKSIRGNEFRVFLDAEPCASAYGWVLFKTYFKINRPSSYFLYSPFTIEVIKLPEIDGLYSRNAATLSLNATSPKCVIFVLTIHMVKVYIKLCSPGDRSWKSFEFDIGLLLDWYGCEVDVAYMDGVLYCLLGSGQLGAFDVEHEEWTILVDYEVNVGRSWYSKLIVRDSDLLLSSYDFVRSRHDESWDLAKLDSSKTNWVYGDNLNNHVLFNGCTSFAAPAIGETSQLADTMFFSHRICPFVRFTGSRSWSCTSQSPLYRKCYKATRRGHAWIELPLGGIWRANDLINAV